MRSVNIWLESRRQRKPLTSGSSGSPNPARNTHGHYAASKFTANTGAQALHVLNFNEVVTGILDKPARNREQTSEEDGQGQTE